MSDRPLNPTCYACGKTFDHTKQARRTTKDYNTTTDGTLCRNRPECRGRTLSRKYEDRGLRRWARQTQEELLLVMDLPPRGWDPAKKWVSIHQPHERIFAAIKFYSVCWPVCIEFAVQTDEDGEPLKEHGEWKRHTHRSLAKILHMQQAQVTRNIEYLKQRNLLTDLEGRLYPDLGPKSLDPLKRDDCIVISESNLKDLAALPSKAFNLVAALKAVLPADDYTVIKAAAIDACTALNLAISDARTEASRKVLDACQPHVSLLSRLGDYKQTQRASSHSEPTKTCSPSKPTIDEGTRRAAAEYLYAEIPRMQAAFPEAAFSKPRFNALGKSDRILTGHILDALEPANYDAIGFILMVAARFKGLDKDGLGKLKPRSPNDTSGPRSLGLLIEWARDYAAAFRGRANGVAS